MVALPQVKKVEDCAKVGGAGVVLIPPGSYEAVILNSEMQSTKDNKGQFLKLDVVITNGEYANTEFVDRLNIINENQKAVDIAFGVLANISKALGMNETPQDSAELHNKPLLIKVETEKGKPWTANDGTEMEGKDKSVIKNYFEFKKSNGVAVASTGPVATANPEVTTGAPAANPFAAS